MKGSARLFTLCGSWLLLVACGSLQVRGGSSLPERAQAVGHRERSFRVGVCREPAGEELPFLSSFTVSVFREPGRPPQALVERAARESWLLDRAAEERGLEIFQLSLTEGERGPLLWDIRLPEQGSGRFSWVRTWVESPGASFRAHFDQAAWTCSLVPVESEEG